MAESSSQPHSGSLTKKSAIWERLRNAKDSVVATAMDKDDSWVRKVRNGECGVLLDDIPRLLRAVGLRVVDLDRVCVDRAVAEAMAVLHAKMAPRVPKLLWEDDDPS